MRVGKDEGDSFPLAGRLVGMIDGCVVLDSHTAGGQKFASRVYLRKVFTFSSAFVQKRGLFPSASSRIARYAFFKSFITRAKSLFY